MRTGKITSYDEIEGRGYLSDAVYREKSFLFFAKGYQAGQIVIYDSHELNPHTGFKAVKIVAPKLWAGIRCL